MSVTSPDDIVDAAEPTLLGEADERSAQDAASFLAPGIPSPTPGEAAVGAKARVILADLEAAQGNESARNKNFLDAHDRGEPVVVPATVPMRRVTPVEFVVMALVGVVETLALTGPVGTILDLPMGSGDRYLIPAIVAVLAAILAHQHGVHWLQARQSRVPRVQDREHRASWFFVAAVFGVAATAVIARIYAAELDAQLSGATTIANEGIAFFIAFQLAFAFGTLALARSYHGRVGAALDERLRTWIQEMRASLAGIDARHPHQRHQVVQGLAEACVRYRNRLADQHPDVEAQVAWRHRTARELESGSLFQRLFSDLFPDDGPPGGGEGGGGGGGATTAPAPDPPRAPDAPAEDDDAASAISSDGDVNDDEDLIDAILNPHTRS